MIDVDRERLQFWLDLCSAPAGGVSLCLVLFGFGFVQPVGLGAVAYAIAGVTCVVTTTASLLVARHRLTGWEAPTEYPAAIRELLPLCWGGIPVLMIVPTVSEPRWQLAFLLPILLIVGVGMAALLTIIYKWLRESGSDRSVDAA